MLTQSKLKKLKKNGLQYCIDVIWKYKIDRLIQNIIVVFTKSKPLKDVIIIESHNDFDCNGGAFYHYLLAHGFNKKYKIIWLLKNPRKKSECLPNNVECYPLYTPNFKKDIYICMAKFFLADNVVTEKKREDQLSIYCSHGAFGLKNVHGICALPASVDYAISPSHNVDSIMANQWSLENSSTRMIHIGYPSEDIFYQCTKDELNTIKKGKFKKTILWMPTFRKGGGFNRNDGIGNSTYGIPLFETEKELNALNDLLKSLNALLVIKIHPMQDDKTIEKLHKKTNIVVLTGKDVKRYGIDNYSMMASVDAMISDYSSAAYVFLHADKPIGIMLGDLNEYKLGLIVDNPEEYIPGQKIFTINDFFKFITDVANGNDPYKAKRRDVFNKIYEYHDGYSCERLAEFMKI